MKKSRPGNRGPGLGWWQWDGSTGAGGERFSMSGIPDTLTGAGGERDLGT